MVRVPIHPGDIFKRSDNPLVEDDKQVARRFALFRHKHYAYEGERAVQLKDRFVIFEATSAPPSWWKPQEDVDAAYEEFIAAGRRL
jgi:hypothetical protein